MDESLERPGRSVFDVVSRRRVVAIVTLVLGIAASIVVAFIVRPYYVGVAHVLLVNDQQGRDPTTEGIDMPTIATSTNVMEAVRKKLHLTLSLDTLKKNVNVKVAPKSSIMTISGKDHNPAQAIAITNEVADEFTSFYANVSGARYGNVVNELRADLEARRARILSLESRLQQQAAESSYVGSQSSLDNTASSLDQLVTQRTFAYAQLVADRAQLESSRVQPGQLSKIIKHETLVNDQNYRQLEVQVSQDVAELAMERAVDTDKFPGLQGEREKVAEEQTTLRRFAAGALSGPTAYSPSLGGQIVAEQKADAAYTGDVARVKALDDQIATVKSQLQQTPSSGPNAGALRALRDTEEAQYQALALRLTNAQANSAEANSLGSIVVIDRADAADPSLLGPNLLLALGLLVAIGLAIAAAYAAESIDPRFISPSDIESVYGRPVLGSIRTR